MSTLPSYYHRSGPMTIDELKERASFAYRDDVYGAKWQDTLKAKAKVCDRQFRRWLSGETKIPGPLAAMVRAHYTLKYFGVELP